MQETLTHFEVQGLRSQFCLADGHAYQDLHSTFDKIVSSLPSIWQTAARLSIYEAEIKFHKSYAKLIKSATLSSYDNFKICPTASNSIDIVAAIVKSKNLKTVMVEPTFDNLALLFKRRGVELDPVSDTELLKAAEADDIDKMLPDLKHYGALFIVNPNNPTGLVFGEAALKNIISFCEKNKILLIIDSCFRLYRREYQDDYSLLINSSISFMVIEDTGKVWPTQDLKASLVYFSEDIKDLFLEIYNEVYLCVSNFALTVIATFFDETSNASLHETIWNIVDTRRKLLRDMLRQQSILSISDISLNSGLPVEWISCHKLQKNDFEICRELKEMNLAILPGRQFYWNSYNQPRRQQNIRISFMKRQELFMPALDILQKYCQKNHSLAFAC